MIDIGANLTREDFFHDLDEVLEKSWVAGLSAVVCTGASLDSSQAASDLAGKFEGRVYFTAGVHPHAASSWNDKVEGKIRDLLSDKRCVAVGETGLDYFRDLSPRDVQRRCFEAQINLAVDLEKPLFLHQRGAAEDFFAILEERSDDLPPFVVHCFTEGPDLARRVLDLGGMIGFTGWICDERRGHEARESAAIVPLDSVLFETDAPFLVPRNRGLPSRCEPSHLPFVISEFALVSGYAKKEVMDASDKNARLFFDLPEAGPRMRF